MMAVFVVIYQRTKRNDMVCEDLARYTSATASSKNHSDRAAIATLLISIDSNFTAEINTYKQPAAETL